MQVCSACRSCVCVCLCVCRVCVWRYCHHGTGARTSFVTFHRPAEVDRLLAREYAASKQRPADDQRSKPHSYAWYLADMLADRLCPVAHAQTISRARTAALALVSGTALVRGTVSRRAACRANVQRTLASYQGALYLVGTKVASISQATAASILRSMASATWY